MEKWVQQVTLAAIIFIASWHSIAATPTETTWKFCVTGDSRGNDKGINSKVLKRLVIELKKEQPEYVLFVGDLVKGYTGAKKLKKQLTYWRDTFMTPLINADIAVYPCRGNHDLVWHKRERVKHQQVVNVALASRTVWNQVFMGKFQLPQNGPDKEKNLTYKIVHNNAVVLCVDAYMPDRRHRINQQWFNNAIKSLANSKTPIHLFAFSHEPVYSVRHRDCLDDFPTQRDQLVKTFLDAGGVAMFFGHDHRYNHATISFNNKTLHQFIVGSGGAPFRHWNGKYADPRVKKITDVSVFGYLLVEINGNQVTMTMKGWTKPGQDGKPTKLQVIDRFTYEI